jgi:hypothetical protein
MKSGYPSADEVIQDLGDKVVDGLSLLVAQAREDLRVYRTTFPDWAADSTERGIMNWIHDRMWAHARRTFDDALDFLEQEPQTFEGMEELRLIAGYRWRPDEARLGGAVPSLRDGLDDVVWVHDLAEAPSGPVTIISPVLPPIRPRPPEIRLASDERVHEGHQEEQ